MLSSYYLVFVSLILFHFFSSRATESHDFLFHKKQISIPLRIHVGLIGFDQEGAAANPNGLEINAEKLEGILYQFFDIREPHFLNGKKLHAEYDIQYNVQNLRPSLIQTYETLLAKQLTVAKEIDLEYIRQYVLDVNEDIKKFFDDLHFSSFEFKNTGNPEYTILIINPDKDRVRTRCVEFGNCAAQLRYHYSYSYSGGVAAQNWISSKRYVVIDLAAGPVSYGPSEHAEGTVGDNTFPRVSWYKREAKSRGISVSQLTGFQAHIASLVSKTIQHVFAPDIAYDSLPFAQRVFIPIIVFSNHDVFNPLAQHAPQPAEAPTTVDVDLITKEISKLFLEQQSVTVVSGRHNLHDHKHISMAFSKAIRFDSTHEMDIFGKFQRVQKPYIDSSILMKELRDSADLLTGGLLKKNSESDFNIDMTFYSDPAPSTEQTKDENKETNAQKKSGRGRKQIEDLENAQNQFPTSSQGTRVIPVYVFSYVGLERATLLDLDSLYAVDKDMVIVLQTNHEFVAVPLFAGQDSVYAGAEHINRYIIAGITKALGGLDGPISVYSPPRKAVVNNYLWAPGHHPFGHLTSEAGISQIFRDAVIRNQVLIQMNVAINDVNEALKEIEEFAQVYITNRFGKNIEHQFELEPDSWIDYLYHQELPNSPIAKTVVEQLHQQLKQIETQILNVAGFIENYQFDEAYRISSLLTIGSRGFKEYTKEQLHLTENELLCCFLHHDISQPVVMNTVYVSLVAMFSAVFLILFILRPAHSHELLNS